MDWIRSNINPNAIGRVYTCEHTTSIEEKVNKGIIQITNLNVFQQPFETMRMAITGKWPEEPDNPRSKWLPNTDPNVLLSAYEGISTISEYLGGSGVEGGLASRAGRGDRVGPAEETISFRDCSECSNTKNKGACPHGGTAIGGNSRSHYNIVQTEMASLVKRSHILPVFNIWTAHETKAKDDYTQMPIVGPDVFGQKATQHVPRWFANVLHLSVNKGKEVVDKVSGDKTNELLYRLWLKDHYDPASPTIPIKAKTSIHAKFAADVPAFLDGGGLALGKFLDLLKKYNQIKEVNVPTIIPA